MPRPIGPIQYQVLKNLTYLPKFRPGGWWQGCGWVWSSARATASVLDTLVERGLATKEPHGTYGKYQITYSGRELLRLRVDSQSSVS